MGIELVSQPRMMVPPPPVTLWSVSIQDSLALVGFLDLDLVFHWKIGNFYDSCRISLAPNGFHYQLQKSGTDEGATNQASLNKGTKNDHLIYERTAETAHPRLMPTVPF